MLIEGYDISVTGVMDEPHIAADIQICNEKKLCVFCHNPFAVMEHMAGGKESDHNLFMCMNCINKMKQFERGILHFLKK